MLYIFGTLNIPHKKTKTVHQSSSQYSLTFQPFSAPILFISTKDLNLKEGQV